MIRAITATAITALNGIRRWFTRLHTFEPGTAPSRLNAYIIREALVMQLMPQNVWPTTQMMRTAFTQAVDIALSSSAIEVPPPSVTAAGLLAANVSASRTM